jgi:molybdenum cofactor biosynthesis protein B
MPHDTSIEPEDISICLLVTSDKVYRGLKADEVTPIIGSILEGHGYSLAMSSIVPNDAGLIAGKILEYAEICDVTIVTGGTGPSSRDMSIDVARTLADKELPGFGELFRYLTYLEEGTKAWLSRASAFVVRGKLVVVLPGSPNASRLALEKLLMPELGHVVGELRKN